MVTASPVPLPGLDDLRPDCANCAGLCCVAMGFQRSSDFGIDKPAGIPCPHLLTTNDCDIHSDLRHLGFPGCVAFDCMGAGQRVVRDWGGRPSWTAGSSQQGESQRLFASFASALGLHELLWYLAQADVYCRDDQAVPTEVADHVQTLRRRVAATPAQAGLDLQEVRDGVGSLLRQVSTHLRHGFGQPETRRGGRQASRGHRTLDLAGARLRGADLSGHDLRGAWLMSAQLQGARLERADLMGADLRGANLAGAQLDTALFLTPAQVAGAYGDRTTTLPPEIPRPAHWEV